MAPTELPLHADLLESNLSVNAALPQAHDKISLKFSISFIKLPRSKSHMLCILGLIVLRDTHNSRLNTKCLMVVMQEDLLPR